MTGEGIWLGRGCEGAYVGDPYQGTQNMVECGSSNGQSSFLKKSNPGSFAIVKLGIFGPVLTHFDPLNAFVCLWPVRGPAGPKSGPEWVQHNNKLAFSRLKLDHLCGLSLLRGRFTLF